MSDNACCMDCSRIAEVSLLVPVWDCPLNEGEKCQHQMSEMVPVGYLCHDCVSLLLSDSYAFMEPERLN